MKPIKARPSKNLLYLMAGLMAFALLIEVFVLFQADWSQEARILLFGVVIVALLIFAIDIVLSWTRMDMEFSRQLSSSLSLGKRVGVSLEFKCQINHAKTMLVKDAIPLSFQCQHRELSTILNPNQRTIVEYQVKPTERGTHDFSHVDIRFLSVFKFWELTYRKVHHSSTKVYPNFSAIAGYNLLHTDNQTIQLGIKKKARRGEGMDFLQLREYREGDSLRQIDWKASSRYQKLISQEYQDSRDQQMIVMLDSGRRMRSQDDELSHFDHSLNATLLLSHIALKQGDSVSVYSFGGEDRYVPPFKGAGNVKHLLNEVYDLYPSHEASDYLVAAQRVSVLNRKRSLVVIVSNLRDEDLDDLLVAVRLLQKKHLVLVANLYEDAIADAKAASTHDFESALRYAGVHHYSKQVDKAMEQLRSLGVWLISCRPSELSVRVVNSYLQIKNASVL